MKFKLVGVGVMLTCLSLIFAGTALAQQNTADIVGNVTDTSGAIVPGAVVTITNIGTNISQTATTSASGDYTFTLLQVGTYTVKVEAKGFKAFTVAPTVLSAGDRARFDAVLQVGDISQTVEISASATPALQTETSSLGTLVTSQAVEDVPLNGRNVTQLIQLSVGVSQGTTNSIVSGTRPDDRRQTAAFSVNGQNDSINNNLVDGMDNNERIIGGNVARPSVDAIQEVNVSTNLYDASVGRTGGGVVDIITKSGTNSFHGSLYEFFRNRVLNTNPGYSFPSSFDKNGVLQYTTVLPKPAFRQNQYGGSIGGPIRKNKTFFFFDIEKLQVAQGTPFQISVPTACERGTQLVALQATAEHVAAPSLASCPGGAATTPGNFKDLAAISAQGGSAGIGAAGSGPDLSNLSNPAASTTPYFGLDKVGLEYFSMYPLPNGPGTINNFSSAPMRTQSSRTIDGRIDQHISDKDTVFGRYSINDVSTYTPNACPDVRIDPATGMVANGTGGVLVAPSCASSFPGPAVERQQSLSLSYVRVVSPNLVANLKAGFLRSAIQSLDADANTNVSNALGFACNSTPVPGVAPLGSCINISPTASGLASITLNVANPANGSNPLTPSYQGFGSAAFLPIFEYDTGFVYSGTLTWNKGAHSIKVGAGVIRRRATIGQSNNPNGAGFQFTGTYTGVPAADLLKGFAVTNSRNYTLYQPGFRMWEPSAYVQDDWHVRKWLTLNLGLRYDIFTPYTEVHGRSTNYDEVRGVVVGASIPGPQQSSSTAGIKTDYTSIAPRFGFSASLPHSFVLRGGFGLSFFPINYQSAYNLKNAPGNFQYSCATQRQDLSQTPCTGTPYDNGATAQYGACPYSSYTVGGVKTNICTQAQANGAPIGATLQKNGPSTVGNVGGWAFDSGLPVPFLNVNQVFAPPTSGPNSCTYGGDLSNYALPNNLGTCPTSIDPYQTFNLTNIQNFGLGPEYLEQANLQMQRAFGANVITIGGVLEMGRHAPKGLGLNVISNCNQTTACNTNLKANNPPLAKAFPWLAKTTVTQQRTDVSDKYAGLQATFVRRFSKGLTTQVNYTWAHALTYAGNSACTPTNSPDGQGGVAQNNPCLFDNVANPASPIPVTWFNQAFMTANSANDVQHRIAWSVNYQLPFAKSSNGIVGTLIKGWATNVGGSWQTGLPFSVTQNASGNNLAGTGVNGNPNQICSGRLENHSLVEWFNPACFRSQTPNTFGTEDGSQLFGPNQKSVAFSLSKEFPLPIREGMRLQFRTEVFNLFNTPNFAVPAAAQATVQFTGCSPSSARCTGDPNPVTNGLTGSIQALNTNQSSRQIQFALKVLF